MKKLLLSFLVAFSLHAHALEPAVKKAWEVNGLKQPESVVFDEVSQVFYVSNINGSPLAKDGNGFISKIGENQKIINLKWIKGLNAPKGLALSNGNLYVADIDALVEINIASAKIIKKYPMPGAKFLNDVVVANNSVYVSDMLTNTISKLENGRFEKWLHDDKLEFPNGLYVKGNRLYVGTWGMMTDGFATKVPGKMISIQLKNKKITNVGRGKPIGNLDGVEFNYHGGFFVTDWMKGDLLKISSNGKVSVLTSLGAGSADLTYIRKEKLLIVPMMNDGKLLGYQVR